MCEPSKKNNHRGPGLHGVDLHKRIMRLSSLFILQRPLERQQSHNGLPLRAQTWPLFFSLAECFILLSPPRVSSYVVPNRTIKELFGAISCRTVTFVKQNALSCKGILNSGCIAGQAFHQRCVAELIVSACETSQAGSLNIPQKHSINGFKYSTLNFSIKDTWMNSYSGLINGAVWVLSFNVGYRFKCSQTLKMQKWQKEYKCLCFKADPWLV